MGIIYNDGFVRSSRRVVDPIPALLPYVYLMSGDYLLNGSNAAQWNDSSGNNRHAVQPGVYYLSSLAVITNSMKGNSVLRSVGGNQYMTLGAYFASANGYTFMVVVRNTDLQTDNTPVNGVFGLANNYYRIITTFGGVGGTGNVSHFTQTNNTIDAAIYEDSSIPAGTIAVYIIRWVATSLVVYKNGVLIGSVTTQNSNKMPNSAYLRLGQRYGTLVVGSPYGHLWRDSLIGDIAEFAMWRRGLTTQEITTVSNYEINKFI